MAEKILIGNWKMNNNRESAMALSLAVSDFVKDYRPSVQVAIAPSFPFLAMVGNGVLQVVAQNCSAHKSGAYTGEVATSMLASVGCHAVIVGHSERRQFYGDSDELVGQKVRAVLDNEMKAVVCCGEMLSERKSGIQNQVVVRQLEAALASVTEDEWPQIIIAYEPVWAIGTGETASPEQAGDMHAFIRKWLVGRTNPAIASRVSILYGGSCNPSNASDLFATPNVDGGLIGGASLKAEDYIFLIKTLDQFARN